MSDPIPEPRDPRAEPRTRNPFLAAAVSLLFPGIGHVYVGRPWRGLVVALAMVAWGTAMLLLSITVPVRGLRIAFLALLPAGRLFAVWDAARVAGPVRHGYELRPYNRWYVYALLAVGAWIASSGLQALVAKNVAHAWSIPSTSMEPTLLQGDFILATPRLGRDVRRGEVVVYQEASGEMAVRRVVAGPGDTVEMRHRVLWLNGRPVREPYVRHTDPLRAQPQDEMRWQLGHLARQSANPPAPTRDDWGPLLVPPGHFLMLGDNRDNSYDGRWKGFVPATALAGRPVWIYYSRASGGRIRWERIGAPVP
jgi:signal peptidase I